MEEGMGADIFDKETTVSKNSGDIERLLIMQRREEVLNSVARALKTPKGTTQQERNEKNAKIEIQMLLSRIGHLIKSSDPELHEKIQTQMKNNELYQTIIEINQYLTRIGLTYFQRKKIDTTNVETENREKEL
jgi:hypothetical protein